MMDIQDLQEKLRERSTERRIFLKNQGNSDIEFERIKSRFTRGKYDTIYELIKW